MFNNSILLHILPGNGDGILGLGNIIITDQLYVFLLSFLASIPAIYAGLFLLKLIKPLTESIALTRAIVASISIGILFASFYDLTKETAGIGTGVLKSLIDVFSIIVFSAVLLSFIALHSYTNKTSGANNTTNNDVDNPTIITSTSKTIPLVLIYAWAILGVGSHSIGEGIIMGYDFSTGATSLSTAQISSFILHKIGEGFTIGVLVTYGLFKNRHLLPMGAFAGVPTIVGAVMGFALFSPTLATYFFASAAGATIFIITRFVYLTTTTSSRYSNGMLVGILAGFLFMYFSGVLHQFE